MFFPLTKHRLWSAILIAVLALLLASPAASGQEKDSGKAAGKAPADGAAAAEEKPAPPLTEAEKNKEPAKEADPFAVPDGTPEELIKYIEQLAQGRPSSDSAHAVAEFRKKTFGALLEASEKLLAAHPNADQTKAGVRFKLVALQALDRLSDPIATQKLDAYPAEVDKLKIDDQDLLRAVHMAQLVSRLRRAKGLSAKDLAAVLGEVKTLVKQSPDDEEVVALAVGAAMLVENSPYKELAVRTYEDFGKLLAASKDEDAAAKGLLLEGAARRLGMVGKKFSLDGTTVEGKKFAWGRYKGKVVLVDFWATWCAPCRAELANVEECYDAYHDRGFDVVGVSVDRDRAALDKFLKEHDPPWTVLHDSQEPAAAAKSLSVRFGIFSIPTMILVGANGDVISVSVRGEELGKQLKKLLGPPKEKKDEKEKKAPGKD
jgi:thiol-disulfide isomerase/thioredoxin